MEPPELLLEPAEVPEPPVIDGTSYEPNIQKKEQENHLVSNIPEPLVVIPES